MRHILLLSPRTLIFGPVYILEQHLARITIGAVYQVILVGKLWPIVSRDFSLFTDRHILQNATENLFKRKINERLMTKKRGRFSTAYGRMSKKAAK